MIAREKAGIIKPAVPHLIGKLPQEASSVMRVHCRQTGAPLYVLTRRSFTQISQADAFDFLGKHLRLENVKMSLAGEHQVHNTALVLKAVEILGNDGFRFTGRNIRRGIARTRWDGRFQIIRENALPTCVLDVCHNASGVEAFVRTFERTFPGRRTAVVLGLVKRKEHQLIVDALGRIASCFSLVPLRSRRTVDLTDLLKLVNWHNIPARRFGRLRTAYTHLLKTSGPDDIISIVGSHYLVGEFLQNYPVT
jgi:dihydrofolate synthase/folylpolyglutamate synthase